MSRFNSKKIALIGLKGEKGEKGEPGDGGIRTLETAPTAETTGFIGEIVQVSNGTAYQCTSIVDGVYTWDRVMKSSNFLFGFTKDGDGLYINTSNGENYFDEYKNSRVGSNVYINNRYFRYGVKKALTNPEWYTGNDATGKLANGRWTDEDRALARATLGIAGGGGFHQHNLSFNGGLFGQAVAYSTKSTAFSNGEDLYLNAVFIKSTTATLNDKINACSILGFTPDDGAGDYGIVLFERDSKALDTISVNNISFTDSVMPL